MNITEQAVKAAIEQLNISDMTLYESYTKGQEAMVRRMLTAAAPYMRDAARAQALEEAAKVLETWGDIYGDNAAKFIRALSSQPVADGVDSSEVTPSSGCVFADMGVDRPTGGSNHVE